MNYKSAFIILDMQNDLCHPEGIFHKHGLTATNVKNILPNIIEMIHFCNKMNIPVIATQLTILENIQKEAIGLGIYKKIRPFLEKEGLRQGSWGHDLLEELSNVNVKIKKWGISSFYQTELPRYLSAMQINELLLAGFTTNGVVETTAREAVGRNYKIATLTDCVASYSESLHQGSLTNLAAFGEIISGKEYREQYTKNLQI